MCYHWDCVIVPQPHAMKHQLWSLTLEMTLISHLRVAFIAISCSGALNVSHLLWLRQHRQWFHQRQWKYDVGIESQVGICRFHDSNLSLHSTFPCGCAFSICGLEMLESGEGVDKPVAALCWIHHAIKTEQKSAACSWKQQRKDMTVDES